MKKHTMIDVMNKGLIGPVNASEGINSSGSIIRFTQKIPTGGIHAVLRTRVAVKVD
jgi:hypothetical protein